MFCALKYRVWVDKTWDIRQLHSHCCVLPLTILIFLLHDPLVSQKELTCFVKYTSVLYFVRDQCVPVTTAWRVRRLRMEEQPPKWRVAANILNKQSRTADKGWSPAWGLGEVLTPPYNEKSILLRNIHRESLWPGPILCYVFRIGIVGGHLWVR